MFLFSCSESNVGTNADQQIEAVEQIESSFSRQFKSVDRKQLYADLKRMIDEIKKMDAAQIEDLNKEDIATLGNPLVVATKNTTIFSTEILKALKPFIEELTLRHTSIHKSDHEKLSNNVKALLRANINRTNRNLDSETLRSIFLNIYNDTYETSMATCSSVFNVQAGNVLLSPGDDLAYANILCPGGSTFILLPGTHYGHTINGSKNYNTWTAYTGAVMDGQNSRGEAFANVLSHNTITYITIKNYTAYGITSNNVSDVQIKYVEFSHIGPNRDGQVYGAVKFRDCSNMKVDNSVFENVTSGIRFIDCEGPLRVRNNEAVNPGRNFFQCDKCIGGGIRINRNSMEHTTGYGNTALEDWINLFQSEGTSFDYIEVNNNRARIILNNGQATKVSNSGCMVILGDDGGKYQEAKNNIGVNPGNCGVGVADGQYMKVRDNKMYSQPVPGVSNVGFYVSDRYENNSTTCRFINLYSGSNESNYDCGGTHGCINPPVYDNNASAPININDDKICTNEIDEPINNDFIQSLIVDGEFGPNIWNTW
jgi:hypothetical protein